VDVVRHGFKSRKLYVITIECPNFLREKESYSFPTDQSGNVVGDEPEKGDDHACDSLRYGYYGYRLNLFPKEYGSLSTSRVPWLR
jgi:phage terminase large subunit